MKKRFVLIALMAPMAIMIPPAAHALVVYDPTNYASNVLQASRALQQINNQIQQIQNQATSLLNEARNLTSLPLSTLSTLQAQIGQTRRLLASAQRIAYDVQDVQNVFATRYSGAVLRGDVQVLLRESVAATRTRSGKRGATTSAGVHRHIGFGQMPEGFAHAIGRHHVDLVGALAEAVGIFVG